MGNGAGKSKVFFLDRDGTINDDMGPAYLSQPEDARLIPGVGRAIVKAQSAGFKIAIITNQAGIAKGLIPRENLTSIHQQLERLIAIEAGVNHFYFDDIQFCPHHPVESCGCRKPGTLMLERSMALLNADAHLSCMVGDTDTDMQCAQKLGLTRILVETGHGAAISAGPMPGNPTIVLPSLVEAIDWWMGVALGAKPPH